MSVPMTKAHKAGKTEAWSKTHLVDDTSGPLTALCGAKIPEIANGGVEQAFSHRGPCLGCERARLARQKREAEEWKAWEDHVDEYAEDAKAPIPTLELANGTTNSIEPVDITINDGASV